MNRKKERDHAKNYQQPKHWQTMNSRIHHPLIPSVLACLSLFAAVSAHAVALTAAICLGAASVQAQEELKPWGEAAKWDGIPVRPAGESEESYHQANSNQWRLQ